MLSAYLPITYVLLRQGQLLRLDDRWSRPSPIPRVGVSSNYGAGVQFVVKSGPILWLLGLCCGLFLAAQAANVLNAALPVTLLNLSGVLAVAYDLGIPTWNTVNKGDGSDTRVTNSFEGVDFDVEVFGTNQYTPQWTLSPSANQTVTVRKFFIHNGHTQSAALRDAIPLRLDFSGHPSSGEAAKAVLEWGLAALSELSALYAASTGTRADDVAAAHAALSVLLPRKPWAAGRGLRLRVQTLARCCALLRSAGNRLGHSWDNVDHEARGCSCWIHRVVNLSPLAGTPDECVAEWFGTGNTSSLLPWTSPEAKAFGESVWNDLKISNSAQLENKPLVMWLFLVAMERLGHVRFTDPDWFPCGTWPRLSLCVVGLRGGCCSGGSGGKTGAPLPDQVCGEDAESAAEGGASVEPQPAKQLWPAPKSVAHVGQRVLRKAALVQAVVSALILARELT